MCGPPTPGNQSPAIVSYVGIDFGRPRAILSPVSSELKQRIIRFRHYPVNAHTSQGSDDGRRPFRSDRAFPDHHRHAPPCAGRPVGPAACRRPGGGPAPGRGRGKDRGDRRRQHKSKKPKKDRCKPRSFALTCAGTCGSVQNNCGMSVNCGPCLCDLGCPDCYICNDGSGECEQDPNAVGNDCGLPGQICQNNGSCACNEFPNDTCPDLDTCGGGSIPGECGCTPDPNYCVERSCLAPLECVAGTCGCADGSVCCSDGRCACPGGACLCTAGGNFCRLSPSGGFCCCTEPDQICVDTGPGAVSCQSP